MNAKTALVVDDSKSARFALRRYLENHQYKVETAESAEEAYTMLRVHRPEVIFLDHVMPGTDGFQALKHIKADPQTGSIPVVICSSNEGAQFTEEARTQGAAHVLQKPPSPERLAGILASLQKLSAELRAPDPDLKFIADTGKFSPDGKPMAAPPTGLTPPPPSKVSNIREPEVAIEQAVMKALRGAIQTRAESMAAAAPPPPPPAPPPAAPVVEVSHAQASALREQMEARLKKITQDLFVQLAELKGAITHLDAQVEETSRLAQQQPAGPDMAAVQSAVHAATTPLQQRLENLERTLAQQMTELRKQIDAGLAAQAQRIDEMTAAACSAAAQEAHAVAERTVMSAASRISDQLSESILKAINPG